MTAQEYIAELTRLLYSLSEQEREEAVAFYRESIADRMDDGLAEEEAVASMVPPAEAACAILSNRAEAAAPVAAETDGAVAAEPLEQPAELAQQPSFWARLKCGKLTPLEWVGVVLSSVIWLPLAAVAFGLVAAVAAIILALYLCAWALVACVWIVGAALVAASVSNVVFILWNLQMGDAASALVNTGYSLVAFGGGMWVLRGAMKLTKLFLRGHTMAACAIKRTPCAPEAAAPDAHVPSASEAPAPSASEASMPEAHVTEAPASPASPASGTPVSPASEALAPEAHVPEAPAPSALRPEVATFFMVCLILLGAGFVSVLAGYILAGFDWHVFLT